MQTNRQKELTPDLADYGPDVRKMREDVLRGLSRDPKRFPSQYLYDERGARLFEKICETDEYYLTRTEIGILEQNIESIAERIGPGALLIEPGSGSGVKTRLLLENLDDPAGYMPIDVAKDQLARFASRLDDDLPDLEVLPVCADFTEQVELPKCDADVRKRVTYFPGSTIGNFTPPGAVALLRHMAELCRADGGVLLGLDLKKDADILERAYDDAAGFSRRFALNILARLNRELGADFEIERFGYEAPFNANQSRIEMALVSCCRQAAHIDRHRVEFDEDERVGTEYSYKYELDTFELLARRAGLRIDSAWTDIDDLFGVLYLDVS